MSTPRHVALASCLLFAGATAGSAASHTVRTLHESLDLSPGTAVRLELPVAEVAVSGSNTDRFDVRVEAQCRSERRRCLEAAEDLALALRQRSDRLDVELEGTRRMRLQGLKLRVEVAMPESSALDLDIGVGEISIEGVAADLRIDVGVGEIDVSADHRSVRSVDIDTGVGESSMRVAGERVAGRRHFLGEDVRWRGEGGAARIRIDAGVGEVSVDLD